MFRKDYINFLFFHLKPAPMKKCSLQEHFFIGGVGRIRRAASGKQSTGLFSNPPFRILPIKNLLQQKNALCKSAFLLEALGGFEPPNQSFADSCLTTWLQRRILNFNIITINYILLYSSE